MALDIHSSFKINNQIALTGGDYKTLSLLYLPLIGIDSYSLYMMLSFLESEDNFDHKRLLDNLHFTSAKMLENAFNKLQAFGLLKVYVNKQMSFLYELVSPLSDSLFLNDATLKALLESEIGESEVAKFSKKKTSSKNYQETTKTFNEVFTTSTKTNLDIFDKMINAKTSNNITINNEDFDYSFFKSFFDTKFINNNVLETKEFKDTIYRVSYLFKLNEEEMHEVIIKTITIDKDLKLSDITANAKKLFQKKNNDKTPKLVNNEKDAFINSVVDDETKELLNYLENSSPSDVLRSTSGISPSVSEIAMIDALLEKTHFSPAVINVMILMVLKEKNGELPSYNYFEKIANTWARANIKTALDALTYMKNKTKTVPSNSKTKTSYKKDKTLKPEWYDDYQKGLENKKIDSSEDDGNIDKVFERAKSILEGK